MSRGDCHAILGGSVAKARHIVRRGDPADIIRDNMGAGQSTLTGLPGDTCVNSASALGGYQSWRSAPAEFRSDVFENAFEHAGVVVHAQPGFCGFRRRCKLLTAKRREMSDECQAACRTTCH